MNDRLISALPLEEVARRPWPGMAIPGSIQFSPDDELITFLYSPDGTLNRQLYAFDPASRQRRLLLAPAGGGTTEETVSLEEALRRERQRQLETGVTHYAWSKEGGRILLPLQGDLFIMDSPESEPRLLAASEGQAIVDPCFSPDGRWVAYVQDAELHVIPVEGGRPQRLTFGARESGRSNGLAEFVAQEEMDRSHGYWWSPDSGRLAFVEVDERHIPVYRIVHQGKASIGEGAQEDHRYPFAGRENARVRLGVVPVQGGNPVWMDLGPEQDIYLARVQWLPDGHLVAQVENRTQTQLALLRFDPETGQSKLLLREVNDTWINLHDMFEPLKAGAGPYGGCFIWGAERDGFMHLYLHDGDGRLIRQITRGEWLVTELAAVDQEKELVYFTATMESPLENHLYVTSLSGGRPRKITTLAGMHSVTIDHGRERFVDVHHALDRPPQVILCSLQDGTALDAIYDELDSRITSLKLAPPEVVTFENRDGLALHGALYRPAEGLGEAPYPTIIWVYGGPHAQLVTNGWGPTVAMRAQYLRSLGFLVFVVDNRGSARRGLAFEGTIKGDMGHYEVLDQVDGVRWLVAQGLADPDRVGIYGWSYGGYMAAMGLARAPETFRVAVAGAPVTHWEGYDTHYTERYMGLPADNPEGYEQSSVLHHVDGMRGKLLLVHGLIDENVHFRHTARLINALIAARKPYDLLLFPDERHSPRSLGDRVFMEEQVRDYFLENL
ncbi:MAG: S9 family peptidase [Chloroflexota bacterium]